MYNCIFRRICGAISRVIAEGWKHCRDVGDISSLDMFFDYTTIWQETECVGDMKAKFELDARLLAQIHLRRIHWFNDLTPTLDQSRLASSMTYTLEQMSYRMVLGTALGRLLRWIPLSKKMKDACSYIHEFLDAASDKALRAIAEQRSLVNYPRR